MKSDNISIFYFNAVKKSSTYVLTFQRAVGRCETASGRAEIRFGAAALKHSRRRRDSPIQLIGEAEFLRELRWYRGMFLPSDKAGIFYFANITEITYKDVIIW